MKRLLLAFAVIFLGSNFVVAQTSIAWSSTSGTTFSTGSNWTGGVAPADSLTTNTASFTSFTNAVSPALTTSQSIAGLVFNSGGTGSVNFTLSGSATLTLGASGISDAAGSRIETISVPLVLGAAQSWVNTGASGTLTTSGTVGLSGFALTIQAGAGGATSSINVTGVISGTGGGSITKSGGSALTLSGANTYSGGTTMSNGATTAAGTLNINNGGSGGTSSAIGTGTLTIGGTSPAIDNTSGAAVTLSTNNAQSWNSNFTFTGTNDLNLGTGAVTLGATRTVTTTAGTLTVGGVISGSTFGLTKAGSGTLTLSGANTYTGVTTINAGTLSVSTLANGGAASGIGASANNATNLVIDGGTLQYTGATVSTDRKIKIGNTTAGGSATLDASGTGALTFSATGTSAFSYGTTNQTRFLTLAGSNTNSNTLSGILADNGTGTTSLTKSGTGTWVLSGANTYSAGTNINAGTLALGASQALGTSGNITFGGGTLQHGASNTTDYSSRLASSGSAIAVDTNGQSVTYASTLASSNTGGLTKSGSGTLTLTGDNSSGYTGTTTISSGTLQVGSGSTSGTLGSGSVSNSGTLVFNRTNSMTVSNTISGSGAVTQSGSGITTLSGTNTYTGATTVSAGTLSVNGSTASGSAVSVGASGTLGGTGTVGGATTVSGNIAPGNSVGNLTFSNGLTLNSGSTYVWELGSLTTSGGGTNFDLITISGGNLTIASGAILSLSLSTLAPQNNDPFWNTNRSWTIISNSGTITGTALAINNSAWSGYGTFATGANGSNLDLNWTVAAIPEPSTCAVILGAVVLAGVMFRRHRQQHAA